MPDDLLHIQETELTDLLEKKNEAPGGGLTWHRLFGHGDPYAEINWEIRTARIVKGGGEAVFEQKNVEVPDFWSQTATDIVASKYFRSRPDSPERESSARQIVDRVADTISKWGLDGGYFKTYQDYLNFRDDLKFLLINQYAAFNSPVWFNVGVQEHAQSSACFILSVEDTMKSILEWYHDEVVIFKHGSGAGLNISSLRSSKEPLSKGGFSSGPVSFMKGADGVANSIKSGGATRRAAKMVVMNADHPDIKDFIYCKKYIEDMTKALEASGVKASIEGDLFNPYTLLPYQNANNSVRVTDEFMAKLENDEDWELKAVVTGETLETVKAREVMNWIADAAWHSADPGMQFDTTINDWHTLTNTGPITASNPCSEFMSIDNSSCNLASINLLKFSQTDGSYDIESYKKAIDTIITAQEIIVSNASYPTERITRNTIDYRQLGLGYANIGALLMSMGFPYDSDEGRRITGALTSILCGEAYLTSAKIASILGPFAGYQKNREPMLRVIRKHASAAETLASNARLMIPPDGQITNGMEFDGNSLGNGYPAAGPDGAVGAGWQEGLFRETVSVWHEALAWGERFGYRNSQATVIAPTGTIAFLMDCQTTGIEPELALVKYKKLVGGGLLKLVNNQVPTALRRLDYGEAQISEIGNYILEKETIEGAPHLKSEHLPVFDCSFKAANGVRSISYLGHIKMMGAVQPFVSGAISKTVNLPSDATADDIRDAFIQAWKHGLKAVAVYRDGSKSVQPLNTSKDEKFVERVNGYTRTKLPDERPSITHKFTIGNHEGYLTVGLYPETQKPGETFITIAKEGSAISGLLDTIATLISMSLQSGIPLKTLVNKFRDMKFEPSGITSNPDIPFAKSFIDYIFRYLGYKFLSETDKEEIFGKVNQFKEANQSNADIALPSFSRPRTEVAPAFWHEGTKGPRQKAERPRADIDPGLWHEGTEGQKGLAGKAKFNFGSGTGNLGTGTTDAPLCEKCGFMMFKAGSCYTCPNCFATTGVCN